MSPLVAPSGVAGLDLDGMERLLTGRRIGMAFSIDEDAFVLGGQTSATDLPDQLRLLATKLVQPRWDPALLARFRRARSTATICNSPPPRPAPGASWAA